MARDSSGVASLVPKSSSYATEAAYIASLIDASVLDPAATQFTYFQRHLTPGKNFWQAALVGGILLGAFASALSSRSLRSAVSPIWAKATCVGSFAGQALMAFAGRVHPAAGRAHRRRLHERTRHQRHGAALGQLHHCGGGDVRGRCRHRMLMRRI